ncbi:carboxylating nicotinate-nucleotide diphosphorylase [Azospira inquinata]|uniref:Probable nicotinate-nucleotide pyrophosphorylase [carboxylating] n=1 Tax=Azospira inquinata TaxID=2785627 RepID=A0A975SP27_9RHOO|nr:carboxylating nicotinate-nucleotide diphosphorylase [Azospira inquinata]QWT49370.1 carboxylating nicotinate-nucleotide diphosphorylase [Azospira inquinata]
MELILPPAAEIDRNVDAALAEDVGAGDLTAQLIPAGQMGKATVISREPAVLAGAPWFNKAFRRVSENVTLHWHVKDGERVAPNQLLCEITGPARALLTAERTGLNFLQLLSGVATHTRQFVDAVAGTRARIVDTRKTLPGLRLAEKYAVTCGGGANHRIGLYDAILIKENHILAAGSITAALAAARNTAAAAGERCTFIQVEVESLGELDEALAAGATMVLLDNMSLDDMAEAARRNQGRAVLEASGGVNLDTVRAIAETGVDRISIGSLTKDVRALDLSMRFKAD